MVATTASIVDTTITAILSREGWPTITNRAADRSGLTKGGITFSQFNTWLRLNGKSATTPVDFDQACTEDAARQMLLEQIARPFLYLADTAPSLFALMFDWATTSGPDDPVRGLQRVLRKAGRYSGSVDGIMGAGTRDAIRSYNTEALEAFVVPMVQDRVRFYIQLATDRDPAVVNFRKMHPTTDLENVEGWVNRALTFLD